MSAKILFNFQDEFLVTKNEAKHFLFPEPVSQNFLRP